MLIMSTMKGEYGSYDDKATTSAKADDDGAIVQARGKNCVDVDLVVRLWQ